MIHRNVCVCERDAQFPESVQPIERDEDALSNAISASLFPVDGHKEPRISFLPKPASQLCTSDRQSKVANSPASSTQSYLPAEPHKHLDAAAWYIIARAGLSRDRIYFKALSEIGK